MKKLIYFQLRAEKNPILMQLFAKYEIKLVFFSEKKPNLSSTPCNLSKSERNSFKLKDNNQSLSYIDLLNEENNGKASKEMEGGV